MTYARRLGVMPTPNLDFFEQSETPSAVSLEDFEQHRNTVRSATGVLSTPHDQSRSNPLLEPFHFEFHASSLLIHHHSAPDGPRAVHRPWCGQRSLPVGSFPVLGPDYRCLAAVGNSRLYSTSGPTPAPSCFQNPTVTAF